MNVSLVSMPFGPLFTPSIALGLLKSIATQHGCNPKAHYLNIEFAKCIGAPFYHDIAAGFFPTHLLIGEWVFSRCLNVELSKINESFISDIIGPLFPSGYYDIYDRRILFDKFCDDLLRSRELASAFIDECVQLLLKTSPHVIGITSVFQQHVASLSLARRLKAASPETTIVLGGANCEGSMGRSVINSAPWVDAVISGEGEKAFENILVKLKAGGRLAKFPGVFLQGERPNLPILNDRLASAPSMDLDELPTPDYSEFFEQLAESQLNLSFLQIQIPFETSRGCWWGEKHHCTFCGLNGQSMTFRSKTAKKALTELRELIDRYPAKSVGVTDNILDMKYFHDFLPDLAKLKLDIQLFYEVKANLSFPQLKQLKDAGITHIQPGIESFSDEVLRIMRKGVSAIQNVQLLRDCAVTGVIPEWNMLWGFPGESPLEYERIATMLPSLFHLKPPTAASRLRLDRFSPLFENADRLGVVAPKPAPAYEYVYPYDHNIINQMAYYFQFSYEDDRNVDVYTKGVSQSVRHWKEEHAKSELVFTDKGTLLLIWDTRTQAAKPLTVLVGSERSIYLQCLRAKKTSALFAEVESSDHTVLRQFITEMIETRLMVDINSSLLSLALPLEEYKPCAEGLSEVIETIRSVTNFCTGDENLTIPTDRYRPAARLSFDILPHQTSDLSSCAISAF